VPMIAEGRVLGVIALANDEIKNLYGPDDQEVLQTMANQAAVALDSARLVTRLDAVNRVSQMLTSGTDLKTDQILESIYEQATRLMDTRNMYVAFYDAAQAKLSFPLATYSGKREQWPARRVDIEDETKGGLTEEVIRTKEPLCPLDVGAWYEERGIQPAVLPVPKSWLGVPMMVEDRVLGVIALQNDEVENLYGPNDRSVLQTMASQAAMAAMAFENARLYAEMVERTREWREAQERAVAAEKLAMMSQVAAEFAHRMNNLAGTIPIRINVAKEILSVDSPREGKVIRQLDGIASDTRLLLEAAQEIKRTTEARAPENVAVNELLDIAIGTVRASQPDVDEGRILLKKRFSHNLPLICVERNRLLDTLISLITNGVEANRGEGVVTIVSRKGLMKDRQCIEITISDTGTGIPASDLPKIFDLFYTTKEKGLGYGLWRDRTFIIGLGGDLIVQSEEGKGSTFAIKIPLEEQK